MKTLLISIIIALLLPACSIHKLEIQQGNVITMEMIDSLKIGMDKGKVEFIIGSAPIKDPFHHNRWDYIYLMKKHGEAEENRHVILFFDDNDKLIRIEKPNLPTAE
jgi:outer membrane protein assembly factor BamE